jgi:hypothetical protein
VGTELIPSASVIVQLAARDHGLQLDYVAGRRERVPNTVHSPSVDRIIHDKSPDSFTSITEQ